MFKYHIPVSGMSNLLQYVDRIILTSKVIKCLSWRQVVLVHWDSSGFSVTEEACIYQQSSPHSLLRSWYQMFLSFEVVAHEQVIPYHRSGGHLESCILSQQVVNCCILDHMHTTQCSAIQKYLLISTSNYACVCSWKYELDLFRVQNHCCSLWNNPEGVNLKLLYTHRYIPSNTHIYTYTCCVQW